METENTRNGKGNINGSGGEGAGTAPKRLRKRDYTIDDSLPLRLVEQDVRRVAIGVAQYRETRHALIMLRLDQQYDSHESPNAPSRYKTLERKMSRANRVIL